MIKFIDLFCGIGGMRLGLQQTLDERGIEYSCVLSSEINQSAVETYEANFQEVPAGDIRNIDRFPKHDVLLAGFPCQPFSYAGKQAGFGDTRGTLFFEVERALEQSKPQLFLLENVRGLTTHDSGRTFETILARLEALGYGVGWRVVNSADFGVPQNRMRVYIFGILGHEPKCSLRSRTKFVDTNQHAADRKMSLFPEDDLPCVADILETQVSDEYRLSPDFESALRRAVGNDLEKLAGVRLIDHRGGNSLHSWDLGLRGKCSRDERDLMNSIIGNRRSSRFGRHQDGKALSREQIQTFFSHRNLEAMLDSLVAKGYLRCIDGLYNPTLGNMSFEIYKILDPDSISVTLVSSDAERLGVLANGGVRRLTPREAARLQGFPDEFKVHPVDRKAYFQFGNSVSVPAVRAVLSDIISSNQAVLKRFRGKSMQAGA